MHGGSSDEKRGFHTLFYSHHGRPLLNLGAANVRRASFSKHQAAYAQLLSSVVGPTPNVRVQLGLLVEVV